MALKNLNKRIAVFRGGPSEEYMLSMHSGTDVLSILRDSGNHIDDIVVSKSGEWLLNGLVLDPVKVLEVVDIALLSMQGAYGEDGTIQRIMARHGLAYTGSGAMASTQGFNKMFAKEALTEADILMPRHMRVSRESLSSIPKIATTIATLFGPEYIIKPVSSGSSFGVTSAHSLATLIQALESSLESYPEVLVEERIFGTNVTCAYLADFRNDANYVFPALELRPLANETKLDVLTAQKVIPAQIPRSAKQNIEQLTKKVHTVLNCKQISRSDFVVTPAGKVYFLEINTAPSLAQNSPFVSAAESVGSNLTEILEVLVTTASNKK